MINQDYDYNTDFAFYNVWATRGNIIPKGTRKDYKKEQEGIHFKSAIIRDAYRAGYMILNTGEIIDKKGNIVDYILTENNERIVSLALFEGMLVIKVAILVGLAYHKDKDPDKNYIAYSNGFDDCTPSALYWTEEDTVDTKPIKSDINLYTENPVLQYDMNDNFINEYKNAKEAHIATNIEKRNIVDCLKYKRKSAGGFKWMYKF